MSRAIERRDQNMMSSMDKMRGGIDIDAISRCDLIFGLMNTYTDDMRRIVKPIKS